MSASQTIIAGSEAGAYEKTIASIRLAIEAAREGNVTRTCDNLRRCVEGCTEVGLYVSGGQWGTMATLIDKARAHIAMLQSPQLRVNGDRIGQQLERIAGQIRDLRLKAARGLLH